MNLIEQLGGYESAKEYLANLEKIPMHEQTEDTLYWLPDMLLQYRRQHNIFVVGDSFVNYADDAIYTALSIDQNNRMHGKSGDKNVWTYFGRFGLRHATDAEIKAGRRL